MTEMSVDPGLDQLSREELVARARDLGARRPEVMTRVELRDEIVRLSESDPAVRRRSRGWLGVARDLVASVVDAGLNMPGAAAAIRGDARPAEETTGPPPVATLTLAEIYLAQGHVERALGVLEEVLAAEPEHAAALALRERVLKERELGAFRRRPNALQEEPAEFAPSVPAPAPFVSAPPAVREPPVVEREPVAAAETAPPVIPVELPAFDLTTEAEPAVPAPVTHAEPPIFTAPPEPVPEPEPPPQVDSLPPSAPVPTLAAPSPRPAIVEAAEPVEPACALVQSGAKVEGHYRLPPDAARVLLRVVWFVPSAEGPTEGNIDLTLDPAESRVVLPPVEQAAHVRGALGVEVEGAFKPLAVAWVYRASDAGLNVEFAPPGVEPRALRAQLGRAVADAPV
ncbi:MAG TPA: tetratricopeptide repeat protein [Polyangiaceae bacterium]|nr:tetratricopeptide repeat protein [Polyangiaceae bacterium]